MRRAIYLLLLCSLAMPVIHAFAQEGDSENDEPADDRFTIIVHSANETAEMEGSRLSKMFLKKIKRWPDGEAVKPVDQNERSEAREAFTQAVHGKKVSAIKSFWQRMIFSGRDVPPPEVSDDQSVIDFVKSDPGAVGYVASGTELDDGVKELEVTQ